MYVPLQALGLSVREEEAMVKCRAEVLQLLWLAVACSIASVHGGSSPVLAPNMSSCLQPHNVPPEELPLACCAPPPLSSAPRLFRPTVKQQEDLRVRKPAHAVDESYAQKLARAYALMRALPSDDPRSFPQQASIHCAYCNTVYRQMYSQQLFQVHGSWLFFPFHRWYLYFHERILERLLREDGSIGANETFAITFWNYDHPNGTSLPSLFTASPELFDANRDRSHQAPSPVAIAYSPCVYYDGSPREASTASDNSHAMYRALVRDATTPHKFFGLPYKQGDDPMPGYGTVERLPHNTVHVWTGDRHAIAGRDMGSFYAAARDPIFYAHHAQLDRLWELWKSIEGNRDMADEEFLDAEFAFYNEEAELVRVKAGDCLSPSSLGYGYEEVETPWMEDVPTRESEGVAEMGAGASVCSVGNGDPIVGPCSVVVERDPEQALESEEYLVVSGADWSEGHSAYLDIYLNLPGANASTSTGCVEYVDYLSIVPQFFVGSNSSSGSFSIGDRIRDLNLSAQASVVVTLVPQGLRSTDLSCVPFSIANISVAYLGPALARPTSPLHTPDHSFDL